MFKRWPKLCVYNGIHTGLNVNVRRYFSARLYLDTVHTSLMYAVELMKVCAYAN